MLGDERFREGFLSYLRNMGPQVLVLTICVVLFSLTQPMLANGPDLRGWALLGLATLWGILWFYAWVIASFQFMVNALSALPKTEKEAQALRGLDLPPFQRLSIFLQLILAYSKSIWKEIVISLLCITIEGVTALVLGATGGIKLVSDLAHH